jgi:hypothetical protein
MPKAPLPDFMNSRKLSMFFSQKFKYWVVPPPPGIITASNFFKTPPAISLVVMVRTLISGSRLTAATASQMQVCAPPCPLNTPNNCNNYPAPKLLRYPLSAAPPSPRGTVEVTSSCKLPSTNAERQPQGLSFIVGAENETRTRGVALLRQSFYVTPCRLRRLPLGGQLKSLRSRKLPSTNAERQPQGLSFIVGAENETRTRDFNLGKVALYQLSYFRIGDCKYKLFF